MKKLLCVLLLCCVFPVNADIADLEGVAIKSTRSLLIHWTGTGAAEYEVEGYFTRTNSKLTLPWVPFGKTAATNFVWCCYSGKGYYHFRVRGIGETEWSNTAVVRVQ